MRTKDHSLLGKYLLEKRDANPDLISRNFFLLGCVEPDINLITYTRGSLKYQFLHGHNAENAKKHLINLTEKLTVSGINTPFQWFRFGAALHYLADSFTFSHNRCFLGKLNEHRLYENMLHCVFVDYLHSYNAENCSYDKFSHIEYLNEQRSYLTDCRYIVGATFALYDKIITRSYASRFTKLTEI